MTKHQKQTLAQAYQSAWFAYTGQPIVVSIDENGFFTVRYEKANVTIMPEWLRKMNNDAFILSLSHITLSMAVKRETQE